MPERTYLNDFITLSVLPVGWAPGDSFRRLKMPSLFFMSLALGTEAEKGVGEAGPLVPCQFRVGRAGAGARGTYSFMVCRLWRFPFRVRYMPRSIAVGPPTLLPGSVCCKHPQAPAPKPGTRRQRCRRQPSAHWNPSPGQLDSQAQARLGLRQEEPGNGRDQDGRREKKNIPPGQP